MDGKYTTKLIFFSKRQNSNVARDKNVKMLIIFLILD